MKERELEHKTISLEHGDITLLHWRGRGKPRVFLHGLFDSAGSWNELCAGIPYESIAIDLPGFGGSHPPKEGRFKDYSEIIYQTLDILDIPQFHLIGHSMGGGIASYMAKEDPKRVESLLLLAPAGYGPMPMADLFALPLIRQAASEISTRASAWRPLTNWTYTYLVTNHNKPSSDLLERLTHLGPMRRKGISKAISALADAGHKGSLYEHKNFYPGPVRCIWGREDSLIPFSHMERARDTLPQTELQVWEEVGHHPQGEDPERVREAMFEDFSFQKKFLDLPRRLLPLRRQERTQ